MFLFGQFLPQLVRGQLEQLPEAQVREFQHSRRIRGTELLDPVALGIGPLAGLGPAVRTSPGGEPAETFARSFRPPVTSILITGKGRGNPKAPMSGASIMA